MSTAHGPTLMNDNNNNVNNDEKNTTRQAKTAENLRCMQTVEMKNVFYHF